MTSSNPVLGAVTANGRVFLFSLVAGVIVALGVRSMFVGPDGGTQEARADPAGVAESHHADPGHEGHEHAASTAVPAGNEDHAGHAAEGGMKPDDQRGGHEGHDGSGDDEESDTDGGAEGKSVAAPKGVLLELGNSTCPVMGGEVNEKTFTEWSGLRVGHCCPGCQKRFLANPEALLDEVTPKWRDAQKAAQAIDAAEGDERARLLAAAEKRWRVLRQPTGRIEPAKPVGLLLDLGNENCPVMGGEVNGTTYTEWNGLRVGHCCPGCSKRFLKNPEKLLDEVSPKWREAAAAVTAANAARGDARQDALTALGKRWTVVRQPAPEPKRTEKPDKSEKTD